MIIICDLRESAMIKREISSLIKAKLFKNEAIIIYGARQVGKTTLVNDIIKETALPSISLKGDDTDIRELFEKPNLTKLQSIVGNSKIVLIA